MPRPNDPPDSTALDDFLGPNAGYVLDLYDRYLGDPSAVDPATRALFTRWSPADVGVDGVGAAREGALPPIVVSPDTELLVNTSDLARAIRAFGHLAARLDPLGSEQPGDPWLELGTRGLTERDLARMPARLIGGPIGAGAPNALDAMQRLRAVYCGTTGYEFRQVQNPIERAWLQNAVESQQFCDPNEPIDEQLILRQLTEVEAFERFLHRAFVGQKRFSIEGMDTLVPMLLEFVGCAAEAGARSVWLGMAHRGRLPVLAFVLGKPLEDIFAELRRAGASESVPASERTDRGWTGDVTYHLGARRAYQAGQPVDMTIALAPNPSHLEFVNPVVQGMCRAADERRTGPGAPIQDEKRSVALLIHGDAAFPGEGVVAETLNMSRLEGYRTGGTIHIITNNQLGFTTPPSSGRSTLYASDLAKGFEIPIAHVNADDPAACIAAIRLAHEYREQFRKDFLIDLVGYRRWGHNEGDEPSFTQPLLYKAIAEHPTVRALWAERLVERGEIGAAEVQAMLREATARFQASLDALSSESADTATPAAPADEDGEDGAIQTAVPISRLERINRQLADVPRGFTVNPKLARFVERRRTAFGDGGTIDWAHAEALAFATLLADGTSIRLTGQDTERGTFSQRHLVLHDAANGATFCPLQAMPDARASFEVHDSPLNEAATLGFEYGYSVQAPDVLVLWEAQFGDFANAGQVLIDQFIAAGRAKWGQTSSLVLLLPHGLEGQGPEHSSARIERFLQLAAQENLRIANCTTAAQYFHLLRRQAALVWRKPRPLVVFTPKGLLRHPLAASRPSELARGTFQAAIDDPEAAEDRPGVMRLIFCTGRVFVDLAASPIRAERRDVAIVRIEQLYPFPRERVAEIVDAYPNARDVLWVQEEPRNMGAWSFVAPRLRAAVPGRIPLGYVGRDERASPAVGAHDLYSVEQANLVRAALATAESVDASTGDARAGIETGAGLEVVHAI